MSLSSLKSFRSVSTPSQHGVVSLLPREQLTVCALLWKTPSNNRSWAPHLWAHGSKNPWAVLLPTSPGPAFLPGAGLPRLTPPRGEVHGRGLLLIVCRFSWLARATGTLPRVSSLAQHGQDSEQDTGSGRRSGDVREKPREGGVRSGLKVPPRHTPSDSLFWVTETWPHLRDRLM